MGEDDTAVVRLGGEGGGRGTRVGGRNARASGSAAAVDANDKRRKGGRKRGYEEDEGAPNDVED